jgi:hypothetical protein
MAFRPVHGAVRASTPLIAPGEERAPLHAAADMLPRPAAVRSTTNNTTGAVTGARVAVLNP